MLVSMKKGLFVLAAVSAFACGQLFGAKLNLSGSDIIAPVLEKEAKTLLAAAGVDAEIDMKGTYFAIPDVLSGKSDVAIVAMPRAGTLPDGLTALPFAYQAAVVVVNSVNPMEEISSKKLFDIYSASAAPRCETWAQAGVSDVGLRDIMAISTSYSDNVVVELFKTEALGGTNIGLWVNMPARKADILNMVKTNNSAIAVLGKAVSGDMVKVLPVSRAGAGKSYAYKPDIENFLNGDYPLTLPFYIVFKKENTQKVKPLVKILLDDKIAEVVDKSDFYAAPKNSRKKSIFELDLAR